MIPRRILLLEEVFSGPSGAIWAVAPFYGYFPPSVEVRKDNRITITKDNRITITKDNRARITQ